MNAVLQRVGFRFLFFLQLLTKMYTYQSETGAKAFFTARKSYSYSLFLNHLKKMLKHYHLMRSLSKIKMHPKRNILWQFSGPFLVLSVS